MASQFPDASKMVLSPAAQAIWDAWNDAYEAQGPLEGMDQPLAAALRAAADQAEDLQVPCSYTGESYQTYDKGLLAAAEHLRAIAAEMEAQ
jgi:hypothetical protein